MRDTRPDYPPEFDEIDGAALRATVADHKAFLLGSSARGES